MTASRSEGETGGADPMMVVGIGASAGGLTALRALFREVPRDAGMAFVVVVHLSPEHESHLADLLQPSCPMPVTQVTEVTPLEAGRVYVIPPGMNIDAIDTHVRLSKLEERRAERAPIDHFFRTLAETHGRHAIGVVLTGTGTDGTLGLRWVKEKGGVTIVQSPEEAEYDGMPRSAIESGFVDLVLPVAGIGRQVVRIAGTRPRVPAAEDGERSVDDTERLLHKVFAQVRASTGHDFSQYKRSTVMRRLSRRMQLQQVETLGAYLTLLRETPEEVARLFDDLLITVTEFFRDAEVYEHLEREVVPALFEGKGRDGRVRVWSVGCSTGEEAYSLAIVLLEHASRMRGGNQTIQVFASDLHEHSLRRARLGVYPETIAASVSPERLRRWFVKENGTYRVRPEVREAVVFAPHNLLKDPPFSRLDLVVCRNVLIYLQRDVQQEVLSLFHYALAPGGFLLLGTAETVDGGQFRVEDKARCLYRRQDVPVQVGRLPVSGRTTVRHDRGGDEAEAIMREESTRPASYGDLHARMVEQYAPASILVGPNHEIVHYSARSGRFMAMPGGEPTNNVLKLVREPLRVELRSALHAARERGRGVRSRPIALTIDGEDARVSLVVCLPDASDLAGYALVIFDEVEPLTPGVSDDGGDGPSTQRELRAELELSRQRLRGLIEEYETSQEEMQASNEELQSTNEELRSTMEELETSKEELQSMNEELTTLNQENRHRVQELSQLSSDLQNLLVATEVATLFLDRDLRIVRFTPQVEDLFNIRSTDRGRPLSDLTHRLGDASLIDDARRVLARLTPVERELASESGRWHLTRIHPYRSGDDRIEGVVITLIDVSGRKRAEQEVAAAREFAEAIVQTLHEPLLVLHPDLTVRSANPAFFEHFAVKPEETIGRLIYELGNNQWDIPELRTLLEDVLPSNSVFNDYEVSHDFESIGERVMLLSARRLDHVQLILLGVRDVTDRKKSELALQASERRLSEVYAQARVGLSEIGRDGRFIRVNEEMCRVLGRTRGELLGTSIVDVTHPDDVAASMEAVGRLFETGESISIDKRYVRPDGSVVYANSTASRLTSTGEASMVVVTVDLTERRQAEERVRVSEERYRLLVESAEEYAIFMMDRAGQVVSWSRGAERIFGWREAEMLGRPGSVIFTEEDLAGGVPDREMATAASEGSAQDDRWHVRKDGTRFWANGVMTALRADGDRLTGYAKVLRDNTESKRHEQQLETMMHELSHRVKNLLAVVQAAADQTMRHSHDLESFRRSFGDRLSAMGKAHSLITRSDWQGADLSELVLSELGHRAAAPAQVELEGPALMLKPDAALTLHMIVHELATNATKYGALSSEKGRLRVTWRLADGALRIDWAEADGPAVEEPGDAGYGTTLIDRLLSYQLKGWIDRTYAHDGFRCTIVLSWAEAAADQAGASG